MKTRESRKLVLLAARMCEGATWSDTSILNISSRGMGLQTTHPPRPGAYVEIRKGHYRIVARVIWCDGDRFGVRSQDVIDAHALAAQGLPNAKQRGKEAYQPTAAEWRRVPKHTGDVALRSRLVARSGEFVCLIIVAAAAATLVYSSVNQALSAPFAKLATALGATE